MDEFEDFFSNVAMDDDDDEKLLLDLELGVRLIYILIKRLTHL